MTPAYDDTTVQIYHGDALDVLRTLPDGCAQTCVTSPPYWGLRDYGVSGQLGLERTPEDYVTRLVSIFREVRRVLAGDGTLWLNLGDSYNGSQQTGGVKSISGNGSSQPHGGIFKDAPGLKPKDLCGIPWRVAFALQQDGWYLRSDIIWSKPNPMPESVTDRPTKAHEYIFLLARGQWKTRVVQFSDLSSERVHFSLDLGLGKPLAGEVFSSFGVVLATSIFNVAQQENDFSLPPFYSEVWKKRADGGDSDFVRSLPVNHRAASVAAQFICSDSSAEEFLRELDGLWPVLSEGNHLLIGRGAAKCALPPSIYRNGDRSITINNAGQVCEVNWIHNSCTIKTPQSCTYYYDAGAVAEPLARPDLAYSLRNRGTANKGANGDRNDSDRTGVPYAPNGDRNRRSVWTVPTQSFEGAHFATFPQDLIKPCILAGAPLGGVVLDPFGGAGTTALVAKNLGRRAILCELNREYIDLSAKRLRQEVLAL